MTKREPITEDEVLSVVMAHPGWTAKTIWQEIDDRRPLRWSVRSRSNTWILVEEMLTKLLQKQLIETDDNGLLYYHKDYQGLKL